MTALNQVMRDIEKNYPNLFDLNTAQGKEFVNRFYKYLELEKKQIFDSFMEGHNVCRCVTDNTDEAEEIFNETYKFNNL